MSSSGRFPLGWVIALKASLRYLSLGHIVLAAIFVAGCGLLSESSHNNLLRTETEDLVGAHLDKRKFLRAASMLGTTPEQDARLLSAMTGVKAEPRADDKPVFRGVERTFSTFITLRDADRIAGNTSYVYGITSAGEYRPSIGMQLNAQIDCIQIEDLILLLGQPERISKVPPSPHARKTGPTDVWTAEYIFNSGRYATFEFNTQTCARHLGVRSERSTKGGLRESHPDLTANSMIS